MPSPKDFRSLPLAERIQLVEDIWDSIAEDQKSLPDHSSVIEEVGARKAHLAADPSSGIDWTDAKKNIRSGPYE